MGGHLDTLAALRLIAEGQRVPPRKYAALQRRALIRVRGHGPGAKPELSEAGRDLLSQERRHA